LVSVPSIELENEIGAAMNAPGNVGCAHRASADAAIDLLAELADDGKGLLVASHDEHLIRRASSILWLEAEGATDGAGPRQADPTLKRDRRPRRTMRE
jgi:hypothetical protein